MAEKEKKVIRETRKSADASSGAGASQKDEKPSVWNLQQFLTEIKLFSIMKQADPQSADYVKLKELSTKLSSSDKKERGEATEAIGRLEEVFSNAKSEAQNNPLEEVLKKAIPGYETKHGLTTLVKSVTEKNKEISALMAENKTIPTAKLTEFEEQLKGLAGELGFRENTRQGFALMNETLARAVELSDVRRHMVAPVVYEDAIARKGALFEAGELSEAEDKGERLQMRSWGKNRRDATRTAIEKFKTNVREELIENNGKKGKELEGKELMDRLTEVRERMADLKSLVGNKHEFSDETLKTLALVEVRYQGLLEERLVKDLKYGSGSTQEMLVGESLDLIIEESKGGKWGRSRAKIAFKEPYENIKKRISNEVKNRQQVVMAGTSPLDTLQDYFEQAQGEGGMEDAMNMGRERDVSVRGKAKQMGALLERAKINTDEILKRMEEIRGKDANSTIQARLEFARDIEKQAFPRLSESERRTLVQFLEGAAGNEQFLNVQNKLKEHVKNGRYGQYLVELKAYIARIGLRETSADFQFAFLLRDAKDVISTYEPDIADEFDSWQSSLFIPPAKSVSPETYRQIFEKVWGAGNLDHVFNPTYANAEAVALRINGEQKNVSAAVFYHLLQRTEKSSRLLNAPVNGFDGTMYGFLIEHLYGKGAKIVGKFEGGVDNRKIVSKTGTVLFDATKDFFDAQYFDLVDRSLQDGAVRKLSLTEMLDQVTWMERYAANFWMYSGEAGKHARHYPKEDLENANKWVFSQDQMFEGYGGHFGKYAGAFWQHAKLGHLLREIRAYKDTGIVKGSILETLKAGGMEEGRAATFAKLLSNKLVRKINVDGKVFKADLLSLEEARLMGNSFQSPVEAWNVAGKDWLIAHGVPEEMVVDSDFIKMILDKKEKKIKLSETEENWAAQAEEFFELSKSLRWTKEEENFFSTVTADELRGLVAKQNIIFGTKFNPANMREFVDNFEFAAVLDLGKYAQGTDPVEYAQKYMKLAEAVSKLLPKIELGKARAKDFMEVQESLRAYLTPEEVDDYIEILLRKTIQTHTEQIIPYTVAKTKADQRTIDYREQKAADGHTFYFIDRDGHRIAKTEEVTGNYFKKRFNMKNWRAGDVEVLMAAMAGEAMIPKNISESILDDLVGGGRALDKIFERIGLDTRDKKSKARLVKMVLARAYRLVKRLPLFDDPGWALWSFGAELVNYTMEVGKEVVKTGTK